MHLWIKYALAVGLLTTPASAPAQSYNWDCQFESNLVAWAALYKAQNPTDTDTEAVKGLSGVLDTLAQTGGGKLTTFEQGEIRRIVAFAYHASPDESPKDVAMDYFRACERPR